MKRVALAFLALVSVAHAQVNPPNQTLLQELQLPFTGKNGYEEYLMAADTTRTPAMRSFFRWRTYIEGGLLGNEPGAAPTTPRPADLRDPLSLLTLRQASVTRIAPALDLIRRGNQKAVFSPHPEMKGELLFPELAEFRNLARLGVDAMYAHSAT